MPAWPNDDKRINLRPILLGVCAAWGLLIGFLFNTFYPATTPVEVVQPTPTTTADMADAPEAETVPARPVIEPVRRTVAPPPEPIPELAGVAEGESPFQEPERTAFLDQRPPTPELGLMARGGLSAETFPPPPKPILRLQQPSPDLPQPIRSGQGTPRGGPEIFDDPDLVF